MARNYRFGSRDNPILAQAYDDATAHAIPQAAYFKFCDQYRSAVGRGIAWEFTLSSWWAWWQVDSRWLHRGRGKHQLVMARHGDVGPYSPGNVYPASPGQNAADRTAGARNAATERSRRTREANGTPWGTHLKVRGKGHPRSRAVVTPLGRFESGALAAEAHGVHRNTIGQDVRRKRPGYRFADELPS